MKAKEEEKREKGRLVGLGEEKKGDGKIWRKEKRKRQGKQERKIFVRLGGGGKGEKRKGVR